SSATLAPRRGTTSVCSKAWTSFPVSWRRRSSRASSTSPNRLRNSSGQLRPRDRRLAPEGPRDPVERGRRDGEHRDAGAGESEDDLADPEQRRVDGHDSGDPVRPRKRAAGDRLTPVPEPLRHARPARAARPYPTIEGL